MTDSAVIHFTRLTALKELKIRPSQDTSATFKSPNTLDSFSILTKLVVIKFQLDPDMLSSCNQLKHLEVPETRFTSLIKLSNLEYLNVSRAPLRGLGDISKLTSVTVKVPGPTLYHLSGLSLLQFFNYQQNNSDEYWHTLAKMTSLTLYHVEKNHKLLNVIGID